MPDDTNLDLGPDGYLRDVDAVHDLLDEAYPETDLGNKDDLLDELVYIVLSTRTREEFYQEAFRRVESLVADWNDLLDVELPLLEEAIGSAGLASKKAKTLKAIASELEKEFGEVTLAPLEGMTTDEAERFLLSLSGVGIKTAKCTLMYASDRPVFPLDTHCRRVGERIGWFGYPKRQMPKSLLEAIEAAIRPSIRKSLHIRLIQHGRTVCLATGPSCEECNVKRACNYYAKVSFA